MNSPLQPGRRIKQPTTTMTAVPCRSGSFPSLFINKVNGLIYVSQSIIWGGGSVTKQNNRKGEEGENDRLERRYCCSPPLSCVVDLLGKFCECSEPKLCSHDSNSGWDQDIGALCVPIQVQCIPLVRSTDVRSILNGSARFLVQFLLDKTAEPLSGPHCTE